MFADSMGTFAYEVFLGYEESFITIYDYEADLVNNKMYQDLTR